MFFDEMVLTKSSYKIFFIKCLVLGAVTISALVGCASKGPYQIELMPPPDVYDTQRINPYADAETMRKRVPWTGILYATDRAPAVEEDKENLIYANQRGYLVRLGRADIGFKDQTIDWEEARRISLLKNRTEKYPLNVKSVEEYGILDRSYHPFMRPEDKADEPHAAAKRYAAEINEKLAVSDVKDIFIYVHGYKVIFENPILVAAELWHFLGYEGVFISYAWPSTPSVWAYFADSQTAKVSSHQLRVFLEYLAEETDVERIHILGYSAGTQLVVDTIYQLALTNKHKTPEQIHKDTKIGRVVLIGSDVDTGLFASYLMDGFLDVTTHTSIYVSGKDKALGMSKMLLGDKKRLGQDWQSDVSEQVRNVLSKAEDEISFINVSDTEGAEENNGHAYFRKSPWASSDILMGLMHDLTPEERGLTKAPGELAWTFPDDYIARLRARLAQIYPELKDMNNE
ncbi:MAG: alpha/beta hydrolase [Gammaproteobacteria bacterium]|jgi:esterase/lipase superfamily enzyme